MPGTISSSNKGPSNKSPYVPSWCYPNNSPKICLCGHHEGYHSDRSLGGKCLLCDCPGIPEEYVTTMEEFSNWEPELDW